MESHLKLTFSLLPSESSALNHNSQASHPDMRLQGLPYLFIPCNKWKLLLHARHVLNILLICLIFITPLQSWYYYFLYLWFPQLFLAVHGFRPASTLPGPPFWLPPLHTFQSLTIVCYLPTDLGSQGQGPEPGHSLQLSPRHPSSCESSQRPNRAFPEFQLQLGQEPRGSSALQGHRTRRAEFKTKNSRCA